VAPSFEFDAVLTTAPAAPLLVGALDLLEPAELLAVVLELLLPHAASSIDAASVGTRNFVI
jgi:hypothetical protein